MDRDHEEAEREEGRMSNKQRAVLLLFEGKRMSTTYSRTHIHWRLLETFECILAYTYYVYVVHFGPIYSMC